MTGTDLCFSDIRPDRKADIARALSRVESKGGTVSHAGLLDDAAAAAKAHIIGLTGPPGVGKSTLTNALVRAWRKQDVTVAVIAVDPSSRLTGGALLGDRTRISTDPDDTGVFIRSFAARDRLGGLSDHAVAATRLLSAFYDRVLVESVGIGQSESDLAFAVDTTILCVQPGSGDSLQFMKAGIMELPDIVLVTKADVGRDARRALADVEGALSLSSSRTPAGSACPAAGVRALLASSTSQEGLEELMSACADHWRYLARDNRLGDKRKEQDGYWLRDSVRRNFGSKGLDALKALPDIQRGEGLYQAIAHIVQSLRVISI